MVRKKAGALGTGRREVKVVRLARVKEITGLSASAIYALMQRGLFPENFNLSSMAVGWDEAEIFGWVAARLKAGSARRTVQGKPPVLAPGKTALGRPPKMPPVPTPPPAEAAPKRRRSIPVGKPKGRQRKPPAPPPAA